MSIVILRPVVIKARVTDDLKKRLAADLQESIRGVEQELQQVEFQSKRAALLAAKGGPNQALMEQFEQERTRLSERKAQILEQLKEIARLEPGSEIVRGTVQGTVEVRPGDDWPRLLSAEIVLEDGRVVEIREG